MLKVYGASDDLIEIEGDITEEFNIYPDYGQPYYLATNTGTLLKIVYGDDGWEMRALAGDGIVVQGEMEYSDVYKESHGKVEWVTCGTEMRK